LSSFYFSFNFFSYYSRQFFKFYLLFTIYYSFYFSYCLFYYTFVLNSSYVFLCCSLILSLNNI
jgi:hypothetical protein